MQGVVPLSTHRPSSADHLHCWRDGWQSPALPAVVSMTRAAKVGGNGLAVLFTCMCMIFKV